jgi:hypothetical protein
MEFPLVQESYHQARIVSCLDGSIHGTADDRSCTVPCQQPGTIPFGINGTILQGQIHDPAGGADCPEQAQRTAVLLSEQTESPNDMPVPVHFPFKGRTACPVGDQAMPEIPFLIPMQLKIEVVYQHIAFSEQILVITDRKQLRGRGDLIGIVRLSRASREFDGESGDRMDE